MSKSAIMYALVAATLFVVALVCREFGLSVDDMRHVQYSASLWFLLWIGCKAAYPDDKAKK